TFLFFIEETAGWQKLASFRRALILDAPEGRRTSGLLLRSESGNRPFPVALWEKEFGEKLPDLERKWRKFYNWPETPPTPPPAPHPPAKGFETVVSYSTNRARVQDVVEALAAQAGLRFDRQKSAELASPERGSFVEFSAQGVPLRDALKHLLD